MDDEVVKLAKTMVDVYAFVKDVKFLVPNTKPLVDALTEIAKHTVECANFLEEYVNRGFSGT
jgi:hypothetical protein